MGALRMTRPHKDWLHAYIDYAQFSEAPTRMHFWSGVSAIAGALRRRVWFDQAYFKWYPNFYICFVAPPGIVAKSTTAGLSMNLLRQVEGVHFGPDVVTWPALVGAFANVTEAFEYNKEHLVMSALTLEASELGNLLNPRDRDMVDLLVSLWDGKQGTFQKRTKHSGNDNIENPWINLIACTTPAWIADNFSEYLIGGGLTSRMIFVYAEKKARLVAYPGRHVPADKAAQEKALVQGLRHIAQTLKGPYNLTSEAEAWGELWYEQLYDTRPINMEAEQFKNYVSRKQAHVHKLAMVLAASSSDEMVLHKEHLEIAVQMTTDLEPDMQKVFGRVGRVSDSFYAEKLVAFVTEKGAVPYSDAYRHVHSFFPSMRNFEDVLAGCIRAGFLQLAHRPEGQCLVPGKASQTPIG